MERDYAIVWLGIARRIEDLEELEQIGNQTHPLIRAALVQRLGYYCDKFDNADADEAKYFLLIGRNLAALGLKEGLLVFEAGPGELMAANEIISQQLIAAGISERSGLHVMFHVDND